MSLKKTANKNSSVSISNQISKKPQSNSPTIKNNSKQNQFTFHITAQSVFVESASKPEQRSYFFAYKIKIKNLSSAPAQLMSRHWIITDGLGHTEEVRGPGVVGLQPLIKPQEVFEYESACPLTTSSGSMKGHFYFVSQNEEAFSVEIPEFYLIAPHALN